jgi:hypothetical protein
VFDLVTPARQPVKPDQERIFHLGHFADTKRVGRIRRVAIAEDALQKAWALDPKIDARSCDRWEEVEKPHKLLTSTNYTFFGGWSGSDELARTATEKAKARSDSTPRKEN